MDSPSSSSKTVSLPSIHEMFPEHIERAQNKNDLKEVGSKGKSRESSERSSRSPKGSPSSRHSELSTSRGRPVTNEGPHDVSFDVLRSDPSSSSLQHLTSSTTYPNRGAALTYQSGAGVERGSAPAFRVSVSATPPPGPPSDASSAAPPSTSSQPRGSHNLPADMAGMHINDPQQQARSAGTNNHNGSTSYPSIISFPVSGQRPHSGGPLASQEDNVGNGSEEEGANEASSGKKHVCPTCFKRFNRPSSLRIHVNTHTGATPFRCPWPNCGREFNVNSNMRRHYRNHASPGFARQPTEIRRRRRRIDNSMLEGHPPHLNAPHLAPMRRVSDPYGRTHLATTTSSTICTLPRGQAARTRCLALLMKDHRDRRRLRSLPTIIPTIVGPRTTLLATRKTCLISTNTLRLLRDMVAITRRPHLRRTTHPIATPPRCLITTTTQGLRGITHTHCLVLDPTRLLARASIPPHHLPRISSSPYAIISSVQVPFALTSSFPSTRAANNPQRTNLHCLESISSDGDGEPHRFYDAEASVRLDTSSCAGTTVLQAQLFRANLTEDHYRIAFVSASSSSLLPSADDYLLFLLSHHRLDFIC
ncbi:hypothetical protein CC1G_08877 [Coprinopsis cinerea okayama7|uniref:C2H2-type domain-containing protein n=1 Tax=Coprinopsis cinerea (strain Okayama-7 / 130 / ATCC MYA-4618 / FGSC 9003) TaxID=240176 RepID=A8P846_COPC7|nr:hypothetical protein CC1G_08877 [Coprinopsis cinerea okayama7\|eukprot:XP_001839498.2 hypothetical protein CC1G_08877 [Coprinopsis cinerea okayama7\